MQGEESLILARKMKYKKRNQETHDTGALLNLLTHPITKPT